jgi:hypothetical protein
MIVITKHPERLEKRKGKHANHANPLLLLLHSFL